MLKILKGVGKVIAAGLTAIAILSIVFCFYSLTPVRIENSLGNTDYVWSSNAPWVNMNEGISWGKFDANGFNNKTIVNNPDVIILGSSHIEAFNVMQDKSTGYLLNEKLNGKYSVYNMGISGHDIFKVCQYLPTNLKLYSPKVVIIETSTVDISEVSVNQVLQSSVEYSPSHSNGLMYFLQKLPFLRQIYRQIDGGLIDLFMPGQTKSSVSIEDANIDDLSDSVVVEQSSYDKFFDYLAM